MLTFDKNSGMAVPTAFLAEPGDSLTNWSSKKTLYPSPVSGRGSRLFLLCHVCSHLLTIILTIVLMSDVGAKLMDDQIDATSASLTFSFLFLLLGVIATVVLSATSKRPFANGFALVMIIQAFLLSFILSAVSAVHIHSAVASDHGSRTLILFVLFFQSLGLAFIMSSFTAGVAATVPTDQRIKRLASEPADA